MNEYIENIGPIVQLNTKKDDTERMGGCYTYSFMPTIKCLSGINTVSQSEQGLII